MLPPAAPSWTDQVTAVDWPAPVPVTWAVKASVPRGAVAAFAGLTMTETSGAAVTSTVATSCWTGSATLAATTWNVPMSAGAR